MGDSSKFERIVEARQRLRDRYLAEIAATPSMADTAPQGSGPRNRHGMPKVPVGQTESKKWPVLDLGNQPTIALEDWTLRIDGSCARAQTLNWQEFLRLPQTDDTSDFHCVTTWSKFDMHWRGVRMVDLAALVEPLESARYVLFHAYDGYSTNVALAEALKPDVLLVHTYEDAPLPIEHGGPVRVITPQLYAWKGAKWVNRIEFLAQDRPGFWELRGYSNTAYPWRDDRYG